VKLREVTRKVIDDLEEKSGYPVEVIEDPSLSSPATFRIAREDFSSHELRYKPAGRTQPPDYNICWHCYVAMRLYACPPDQRFLMALTPAGGMELEAILSSPNGISRRYGLDRAKLQAYKGSLLNAIIVHLNSIPIGLRVSETLTIDRWAAALKVRSWYSWEPYPAP
jgi:hypothetical protein